MAASLPVAAEEPRLAPLPESEWNAEQRAVIEPLKQDGSVLNIFSTMGRNPALFQAFLGYGAYLLNASTLPARDREILILRTGWLCQSHYEWTQHARIALEIGMSEKEIHNIAVGPDAKEWTDFERTLINVADELHYDSMISDATWEALSAEYSTDQLLDAIMTVGQYNQVSMLLNSLRIQLEEGVADSMPTDLPKLGLKMPMIRFPHLLSEPVPKIEVERE
ncbi:MAG: carboxymuconolactone decarboxylase family protein [Candidatus Hydrogenedentes bacterium]|nr:carboxymuconolactone decarboxylase family protein [Candidatus Hydrogenedentota bacterium]